MKQRPLVRSALLLMAAGFISRAVGTLYRIMIVRVAGAEALGLFQMVVPLMRAASAFSTLRLPTALTRLTADRLEQRDWAAVHEARLITAYAVVVLSLLTAVALWLSAPAIARTLLTDNRTLILIYLVPLVVIPSACTGIFRGFTEGRQNMVATAASQVAEPLVRLPVVLVLMALWAGRGVEYAAIALVLGTAISELAGLLTQSALSGWKSLPAGEEPRYRQVVGSRSRRRGRRTVRMTVRGRVAMELLRVALPLWATTIINTGAQMLNVTLIPRRLLVAGFDVRRATELYGQMTGMVIPMLYLPMMLVFPVSTVLMPSVTARLARGDRRGARSAVIQALAGTVAVGVATSAAFLVFPEMLARVLYGAPEIAPLVRVAAFAPVFVYTSHLFGAMLNAFGRTDILLISFTVTTAVRLALLYHWTARPEMGISGALWAMNVDHALTALINGWAAWRCFGSGSVTRKR